MRPFIFIVLGSLLSAIFLLPASAQDGAPTYDFRNQFKPGETIYLDMTTHTQGTVTTQDESKPTQSPIDAHLDSVISFKTLKVDSNQSADIEIGFNRMLYSGESLGGATQDYLTTLGLGDRKIVISVNPKGEVVEKTDKQATKSGLDDSVKSFTRQMPYLKFPDHAIPVGYSWSESRQIPNEAASKPMIAHTTYTLDQVIEENGQKIAIIKTDLKIHETNIPIDSDTSARKNIHVVVKYIYKEYTTTGQGEIRFSLDRGRILSTQSAKESTISMQGDTNIDQATFPQNVIQEFSQQDRVLFTDTPPESIVPKSDDASRESNE